MRRRAREDVSDQITAAENFLRDRGVKPGIGVIDVYSTINAGSPGRYNASDAGWCLWNGCHKVNYQMADHRKRAEELLRP